MPHATMLQPQADAGGRRPIAEAFRRTADLAAATCVRAGVSADAVSLASVAAAAGAGLCLVNASSAPWLLLPAAALCVLRLWFNMLDGMVAHAAGTASLRGQVMNELPDRLSDALVFGSIAVSGLATPELGWLCAVGALLVAYTGTLGHALAGRREFGGLMAKPGRMATVAAGCVVTFALGPTAGAPLDPWCVLILAGCAVACVQRVRRTLALLREREGASS